jgi:hypothetical protein
MPRTYRSHRYATGMTARDWLIVVAISLPMTGFAVLLILRVVFG